MPQSEFPCGPINSLCAELLPEAIARVSANGTMVFSLRNLFYTVQELVFTRYGPEFFYKNDRDFSCFILEWEDHFGPIPGMRREPRGRWASITEENRELDGPNDGRLIVGRGNKIIVIENIGLWEVMVANEFHKRLDAVLVGTSGFSTKATRELLIELEKKDLPICVVHDYDIAGVDIRHTLQRPTRRQSTFLKQQTVALGLTWEDVKRLGKDQYPEPMPFKGPKSKKAHLSRVQNRYTEGVISREEAEFLARYRVKLSVLTPRELLDFLHDKLVELDLWKTLPEQEELDEMIEEDLTHAIADVIQDLTNKISLAVKDDLPSDLFPDWIDKLWVLLGHLSLASTRLNLAIEEGAIEQAGELVEIPEAPELTVDEVKAKLEKKETSYWKEVAGAMSWYRCKDAADTENAGLDIDDAVEEILDLEEVQEKIDGYKTTVTNLEKGVREIVPTLDDQTQDDEEE